MNWIKVSDRLPNHEERVLFVLQTGAYRMGIFLNEIADIWLCDDNGYEDYLPRWISYLNDEVQWWIPLPKISEVINKKAEDDED
jgi:hypothetical protein